MNKIFNKIRNFKNIAIFFGIAIFFVADRLIKQYALINSDSSFNILGDFLTFNFTKNYYISFSLPIKGQFLNIAIFIILLLILVYIIYLIINKKRHKYNSIYALLFLSLLLGALSNYIDRLSLSYVIDYLQVKNLSVLNLADIMISVSAFLIILLNIKSDRDIRNLK